MEDNELNQNPEVEVEVTGEKEVNQKNGGYLVTAVGFVSNMEGRTERVVKKADDKINIIEAASLEMETPELSIVEGTSVIARVAVSPFIASCPRLSWYSSDESVVKVDDQISGRGIKEDGIAEVYAIKPGQATVIAAASDGKKCSMEVLVREAPVEKEADWYLVNGEESWNEAYAEGAGPLGKYYESYPQEDLWNVVEDRAANYNDRVYTGTVDAEEVECTAKWESDNAQSVTIDGVKYYAAIFYDMNPRELELFTNVELTESADKTLVIASVAYSGDCQHCWKGTYNAPGAQLPWAVVAPPKPYEGTIRFVYNGENFYPWGNASRIFAKGFAIASIPGELGIAAMPAEEGTNFKKEDLLVTLVPKEFIEPEEEGE